MREIAEAAGVSTGNVYHQFKDKEALFQTLLDDYAVIQASSDYPFNKAISEGAFPEDIEKLGEAIRQSYQQHRSYAMLVYVDVIEFDGRHLRRFYESFSSRFETYLQTERGKQSALLFRDGVSPLTAMLFTTRFLVKHFEVEVLFGVPNAYGRPSSDVMREMTDILKYGLFKSPAKS